MRLRMGIMRGLKGSLGLGGIRGGMVERRMFVEVILGGGTVPRQEWDWIVGCVCRFKAYLMTTVNDFKTSFGVLSDP